SSSTWRYVSVSRSSSNSFFKSDIARGSWLASRAASTTSFTWARSIDEFSMSLWVLRSMDRCEMTGLELDVYGCIGGLLADVHQALARELEQRQQRHHQDGNAQFRIEQLGELDIVRLLQPAQNAAHVLAYRKLRA